MSRKILILIGVPVLIILVAALAVPALVDVNRYRPQIESKLENQLGRGISLGEMRLTLIPLAFRVQNAVIAEAPEFQTGQPFAQTQTLYVQPKLLPLLRGNIEIDSIELNRPSVELVRNTDGTWNFATLATGKKEDGQSVSIDELSIDDGQVGITDLREDKPRTVYDHIDLVLQDFASDKAFSIEGRAHISGAGDQTIVFDGTAGPIQRDAIVGTPLEGNFELNEVSLAGLQRVLNAEALEDSDAVLTGKAQIKNDQGVFSSSGKLAAETPRIRGVDIGYPITAVYNVQGNLNDKTFQIQTADLQLGKTPISVKGRVDAKAAPVTVDLNMVTSNASLADAARLAAAFGVAFSADTKTDGSLDLNVHARGPVNKLVLDGRAAAREVHISGGDLAQPVQVDGIELSLAPTTVQSNEFTAATGGTKVQAQFTVSEYASDAPQVKASVSTGNAQIAELLNIAQAYGISAVEGVKGSGTLQLNVSVNGPVKQTDKLTYSGSGALRNATLELASLAKPVGVRNADLRFNANSVVLDNVDFALGETVARGNLTLHNPAAPRVEFSLAADKINVTEWQALTQSKGKPAPQTAAPAARSRRAQDSLIRRTTGSGQVTVNEVMYDDLVLTGVRSTVKLDKGLITMNPVTAELYGGQQAGTVVLDARTDPVAYSVDLKLNGVDANRLLSTISPIKDGLYGVVSANADTHFTSTGGAAGIARSLDGQVSLNLRDGAIANMDLLHQMSAIGQFLRGAKPVDPVTKVTQLSGDFDIKDGVAQTDNLVATLPAGSFAATGAVDLGQQKLNLRVTAVLSKEYSETVGGTSIGGFMTTAVANQNSELVVPLIITGTFQNPQFAPDLQKVAEMKLQQVVPSADNPAELGAGLLRRIFREKPEGQEQPEGQQEEEQEEKQPEALDRIFGDILRKPQK